jgi:hypothetical protein
MQVKSAGQMLRSVEDIPANVTFSLDSNFSLETAHKEVGRCLSAW